MPVRLRAITYTAADPDRVAAFWADLLGREAVPFDDGVLLPGDTTQVGLAFVGGPPKRLPNRTHLHMTSTTPADQDRTVARVLELGGSHLDVGQRPEEGHVVLADPEGNELCVIEAGNRFLAGTGFLGELAGDGTARLGQFWSAALDWPLVWDEGTETAVQSLAGGTKVAWGGDLVTPHERSHPQRLELVADGDLDDEIRRLVDLGATVTDHQPDLVTLLDPDQNAFVLRAGR